MIKRKDTLFREVKARVRDGVGEVEFLHLLTEEETGGRASLFARVTLEPGRSIGVHDHVTNAEAYVLLQGSAVILEDGGEHPMKPWDVEFCADGHTHGIRNDSGENAVLLALILPNRS